MTKRPAKYPQGPDNAVSRTRALQEPHVRPTNLVTVTDYSKGCKLRCNAVLGRVLHLALGHPDATPAHSWLCLDAST